jgi:hypothetical protein
VELQWRGALARQEAKQRRGWVVRRLSKVEMNFLYKWRVGVKRSEDGGRWRWYGFNTSVLAWEGRQWDEALPKDEVDVASSSWFHGKEAWNGTTAWRHRSEARRNQRGKREETTPVRLTWILLGRKMKKINVVDSADTNERWKFKTKMS